MPSAAIPKALRNLNATPLVVKSGPGTLAALSIINGSAAAAYVQVFDAASAGAVTLGTTEPVLQQLVAAGAQVSVPIAAAGMSFQSGLFVASTTAEKGSVASAAGVVAYAQYN